MNYYRVINQLNTIKSIVIYLINDSSSLYKILLFAFYKIFNIPPLVAPKYFKGRRLFLDVNSGIDRTVFFRGIAHPELVNFLLTILKADDIFFDAGAHSGFFSILAATIIKHGTIHSFEPIAYNNLLIKKSIKLNNLINIRLNRVCLGARDGVTNFYLSSQTDASSIKKTRYQSSIKVIKCRMIKLNTYFKLHNIRKIDILKLDVEGSEKDILFSSPNVFKKNRPIIICEFANDAASAFNFHPNEIYDFLVNLGYRIYRFQDGKLYNQKKKQNYEENLFCIPQEKLNRVKQLF